MKEMKQMQWNATVSNLSMVSEAFNTTRKSEHFWCQHSEWNVTFQDKTAVWHIKNALSNLDGPNKIQ